VSGGARPTTLVVVAGTGTEVGKTWVGATLIRRLRQAGRTVAARKPAQSFDPSDPTTDAAELGAATGEPPEVVCPRHRWYEIPMAPPMAAAELGRAPVLLDELVTELVWPGPSSVDVGLVETAGGVRSPLAEDGDAVALVARLRPEVVVLVADAGLGTLNSVRLSADVLGPAAPESRLLVHLNRFDPADRLHRRNDEWLRRRGSAVTTTVDELAAEVGRTAPSGENG